MSSRENDLILYPDENGIANVSVRFSGEVLWLTERRIAEIYNTTQQNINQHIRSNYVDGDLQADSTYKIFLLVRTEGKRQLELNVDRAVKHVAKGKEGEEHE